MTVLSVAAFLLAATVTGAVLFRSLFQKLSLAETVAWSFAAGLLVEASIEAVLLAARLLPGPRKILGVELILVVASITLDRSIPRWTSPEHHRPSPFLSFLLVASCGAVALFLVLAMTERLSATDFLAIWGLRGRIIYATGSIPVRWAQSEHPLLVPLTFAALSSAARVWDDRALAILYPACHMATVLALWGFASRRISRQAGIYAALLAAVCFPLYSASNMGMAEIPMALGFVLIASSASDAVLENNPWTSGRLALASLLCASTKQEGALFSLLLCGLFSLRGRSRAQKMLAVWVGLPALLHTAAFRLLERPVSRQSYDLTLLSPGRARELLARLAAAACRVLAVLPASGIVALGLAALFLILTRPGVLDWLLLLLGVQTACYLILCALSSYGVAWQVDSAFIRITSTLLPASMLTLCSRLRPEIADAASP